MSMHQELSYVAKTIAHTAFNSPIWDKKRKKWFRCLNIDNGTVDVSPHNYYDLCNIYGIQRSIDLNPELSVYSTGVLDACAWLYWQLKRDGTVGYSSAQIQDHKDIYTMALIPAAFAAGYKISGAKGLLRASRNAFCDYRKYWPCKTRQLVQASNHVVLSALALYELTGDKCFLNDARNECRFLLDLCRFTDGPAAGTFTDDFSNTAFSRHCYGTWALMEMYKYEPNNEYIEACRISLEWWEKRQLSDGGFYFFYDPHRNEWINRTVYSVHQKGMLLLSAWDINAHSDNSFYPMIKKAMALCDDPVWQRKSNDGWMCYKRSNVEEDVVYSYELGWEILGHSKGLC